MDVFLIFTFRPPKPQPKIFGQARQEYIEEKTISIDEMAHNTQTQTSRLEFGGVHRTHNLLTGGISLKDDQHDNNKITQHIAKMMHQKK